MAFIEAHGRMMLHGTITAIIRAYFSMPKSLSKEKRLALQGSRMAKKPDADNVAKAILDALNWLAFEDDAAITSLRVDKFYTDTDTAPRVEITLVDDQ
jgi:Holliday junction resolvase RusA-like endonuclease